MDLDAFRASLAAPRPPDGLGPSLRALWFEARCDWDAAHAEVQDAAGQAPAWVHAYLHRREGDLENADYWYGRAGRARPTGSFQAEWRAIALALLEA